MTSRTGTTTDSHLAARAAAIASLGAAVIHFAVTPEHWRDWLPSGLFFASMAVFQLIWALLAWTRPPAALLAIGAVANAASVALWVLTRTAGMPFGPHAGVPEGVQGASICALLLECYVVMGAVWALHRRNHTETIPDLGRGLVLLGANAVIALAVVAGVVSGLQGHDHHAPAEAEGELPSLVTPADAGTRPAAVPASAPDRTVPASGDHHSGDHHSGDHHGE